MEKTLGDREGQGSLACCSPWGPRESDMTEQLNNSNKFTGAPFTRAKMWKQPKCPLTMNGSAKCVTNTILLFNIKKEVLTCATKWIDLGDIVLSDRSQSQKDKHHTISLYEVSGIVKHTEQKELGCQGLG